MGVSIFPDQTRPDQTRPDQTRPDQNDYTLIFFRKLSQKLNYSFRRTIKKIDRFKVPATCIRFFRRISWNIEYIFFHIINRNKSPKICIVNPVYFYGKYYTGVGLMWYFLRALAIIAYADRHGFIPVVDMKSFLNMYLYDSEIGKINSWEYYFEQPSEIILDDALSDKNSLIGQPGKFSNPNPSTGFYYNYGGELDYWRKICKKYIRFTPAVINRLETLQNRTKGKRILGILVRGTDYLAIKPKNHPIPPTAEQAITKAKEVMSEQNFDSVYLATEDKNIAAKFQKAFGDNLILPACDYLDYDYNTKKILAEYNNKNRTNDKYLRGLEYLVSMLFLSKCPGFITSMTYGSAGVMCLSEGFDYLYVFDLGYYA